MNIGINGTGLVQKASVAAVTSHAQQAAADGFKSYWLAEHPTGGFDALTVLALVGQTVTGLELGTAIVPTFPRHPLTLAGHAATVADTLSSPLTLGIGLSHEPMMAQLGIGFDKPIRHLREYLSILMPLLSTGQVAYTTDPYRFTPQESLDLDVPADHPDADYWRHAVGYQLDGQTEFLGLLGFGYETEPDGEGWVPLSSVRPLQRPGVAPQFDVDVWVQASP